MMKEMYCLTRLKRPMPVDAKWDKYPWVEVPALELSYHMGTRPEHFPQAQAKLAYDEASIHVIFRVADRYVRAQVQNYQDDVFHDSCVELFFSPGAEVAQGYFNLEMNCGGTALFHHQTGRRENDVAVSLKDFEQVQVVQRKLCVFVSLRHCGK